LFLPNPAKPELNIDPPEAERFVVSLSEAQAYNPYEPEASLCLYY
jgi:hypothetical protein